MVGGFVAVQNRLDFGKETLSCYVEVPDEEQGATELQLLSVRFAPTPPLTASWSAFTSVELLSRVFSLRAQFLVSSASESDFLLPFLNDQQTVTLRFVTPDARALSDLETCLAQHTNDLPCSVQHVTPSAVRGQPVVVSNSRGELSLSQTVRGCKSSVVAMKQEGKKEQEGTLFSSTPLLEPVVVKEDEKVGDSMRKEEVNETPEVTVVNETPEVTVVKETQDPPLDPTPLLKESKPWICFVPITHSEAKSPLRRSASIDTLSSLHSTPKKPARTTEAAKPVKPVKSGMSGKVPESEAKEASAQAKSFTPVRQTEKPAEAPVPKAMTKAVATQMAGLSRRKGMSFLSQLLGEEKEAKEVKREVKKEYRRKWQMPSKPREEEEKEEKEEEKEKREEKETEEKQQKEETEKKKQTTPQLEEPEKVEIEGEKVTLPRKRTTRKPQQKRTAPQAQTAGRKKARVETPPPPIETKPAPEADSDFSSSSEDIDTTQLMDTVKSLLSTPKVRVQSTDSTPSSNGSESEDEDPGLLAMQQMMTGG